MRLKTMLFKSVGALSMAGLGWMGAQFFGADQRAAQGAETPLAAWGGEDGRARLSAAEIKGLLAMGAQFGDGTSRLLDPRDICRVVKANAAITTAMSKDYTGAQDYSAAFERCAGRSLRYDMALLRMGDLMGADRVRQAGKGDHCAMGEIAAIHTALRTKRLAQDEIQPPRQMLGTLHEAFAACQLQGPLTIDSEKWNEVVNAMVLSVYHMGLGPSYRLDLPRPF